MIVKSLLWLFKGKLVPQFSLGWGFLIHQLAQYYMEPPTYSKEKPWAIFRLLSIKYSVFTARFRTKREATVYLKIFKEHKPNATYTIVYDPSNAKHPN